MFKKNISAAGSHALGGKDVKSLRRDILKQYNSITEEQLNEILPSKANVTLTKLNNRCQVYGIEGGNPLFFDPDGRGSLLPTVYTLWAFPAVLPTLHTWSEVSPKILGGADLFLQGVLIPEGGLPDWLANSVRTVSVPGNPCPLGIGRMAVSRIEAAREGMKGRGLQLIHHYPDLLWAMGDRSVPNEGFTPQRVFPLKTQPTSDDSAPPAGASSATQEPADGSTAAAEATEEAGRQLQGLTLMQGAEDVAAGGGSAADAAGAAEGQQGEPPSMDALLEEAALRGLKRVTNAELPMQTGDFYTKHMLACKPAGVVFDFKQSSFKKLSKLVDRLEKDKVLTQKVIRKQDNITAVNRQHPRLQALGEEEAAAATPAAARPGGGNSAGGAPSNGGAAVQVTYCYRAPSSLRPVFGAAGRDKERLYSEGEVEAALREYATSAGLLGGAAGQDAVQLDQLLHGALYNKKEPEKTGDTVPLRDVLRRLRDKLQLHHRLVRPGAQGGDVAVVRKGPVKPVHIADERRSGRDVTKVAHLESFVLAPEELAGVFQKKFQCSATVSKLPGKQESDMEVMLQGKLARQVADFLTASYGIPPPFLEVKAGKK